MKNRTYKSNKLWCGRFFFFFTFTPLVWYCVIFKQIIKPKASCSGSLRGSSSQQLLPHFYRTTNRCCFSQGPQTPSRLWSWMFARPPQSPPQLDRAHLCWAPWAKAEACYSVVQVSLVSLGALGELALYSPWARLSLCLRVLEQTLWVLGEGVC